LPTDTLRDRRHCVIGPGRVGSALLAALLAADETVVAVGVSPGAPVRRDAAPPRLPVRSAVDATLAAGGRTVLWLPVPDDAIPAVAEETAEVVDEHRLLADRPVAVHLSGLGRLALLDPLARRGATILSLHPLQSFAESADARTLAGAPIAVTAVDEAGEMLGRQLAAGLGGRPFVLHDDDKALYHLAAVTAANLFVALEAQAASLLRGATGGDVDAAMRRLGPLVATTLENLCASGPSGALTGPVARGDVGTVREHLTLLRGQPPRFAEVYRSLSLDALALAAPRLDDESVAALQDLLGSSTRSGSTADDAPKTNVGEPRQAGA